MSATVGGLSGAVASWIITGSLAYRNQGKPEGPDVDPTLLILLFLLYFIALVVAIVNIPQSPTRSAVNVASAVLLGWSFSCAYCNITPGVWVNYYFNSYWIMSGGFIGGGIEASTGFLAALAQELRL